MCLKFHLFSDGNTKLETQDSFELEEDCRPIDEKDILSYARQIAMGMVRNSLL